MTPEDCTVLKRRIETALAESIRELGEGRRPSDPLTRFVLGIDRAWALVNHDDTRAVLTDNVVLAMGEGPFDVAVDEAEIVIEAAEVDPADAP